MAHRAEIDHTREHARGGPSVSWNLGAWCSHDHRVKHLAGWRVRQPLPGWFVLQTRAGITHTTGPETILRALPTPRPAPAPRPLPADGPDPTGDDPDQDLDPAWREKFAARFAAKFRRRTTPTPAPRAPTILDPADPPPF